MNPLLLAVGLASQAGPTHDHRLPVFVPVPVRVPVYAPPVVAYTPRVVYPPRPARPVPVTLDEFARCFRPTPGRHSVWMIHPCTGRPVEVCFTLPHGRGRVEASRHELEFDYGRREVEIQFRHNGSVDVKYRD